MRILVSGASGFIGRHLVASLHAQGHEAHALVREREPAIAWRGWRSDADAVVHLAALNPSRADAASRDRDALFRANAAATAVLAREAAAAGVRRVVFASTALVHTARGMSPIREDDPPRPQNPYAESKLEGEQQLRTTLANTGTTFTILRLPPVYGFGGRGSVAALARIAALPVPLPFSRAGNPRSVLSLANAVDALTLAAAHPDARHETFLVADGAPISIGEMVRLIRRAADRQAHLFPVPLALLTGLARPFGKASAVDRLLGSFVVDDGKIRQRLRWRPPQSTEEGLRSVAGGDKAAQLPA